MHLRDLITPHYTTPHRITHPHTHTRASQDTVDEDDGAALPMDLIFAVLDKSGDSRLVFAEFIGLFEVLEMDIALDMQVRKHARTP